MRRAEALTLALVVLMAAAGPAAAQPSVDSPDHRLKELESQLERSRAERDDIKRKAKQLADETARLRSDMVASARAAQESEELLSELETQLEDLKTIEYDKASALRRRSRQMTGVLTALQRLAWRPTEALIAQPQSPADTVRSAILLRAAVPQIEQSVRDLRTEMDMLTKLRADIGEQKKRIASTTGRLEDEHRRIKDLFERKTQVRTATETEAQAAERRMQDLAGEAEDLRDLLARLEEERLRRVAEAAAKAAAEKAAREAEIAARKAAREAEIAAQKAAREAELAAQKAARDERERELAQSRAAAEAEMKAQAEARQKELAAQKVAQQAEAAARIAREAELKAQAEAKEKELAAQKAARQVEEAARQAAEAKPVRAEKPFTTAQGKLPYPARGKVVGRFGQTNDVGHVAKGITIETRKTAQVIAPYDGQVVFAGPFRGYGLLLIIEHGEGYHTLLAGMTRIDCGAGQRLSAGEPVGVMGQDDAKPTLYVELRHNGQPVNPLPWLAAQKSKVSG